MNSTIQEQFQAKFNPRQATDYETDCDEFNVDETDEGSVNAKITQVVQK